LENAAFYAKNQDRQRTIKTNHGQVEGKMEEKKALRLTQTVQSAG
jgi:hypothetical protein